MSKFFILKNCLRRRDTQLQKHLYTPTQAHD
jgi:hypothetical protein